MSTWHDFTTSPPQDGQLILARRAAETTLDLYGQWSLAHGGLLLPDHPSHAPGWSVPWTFLTHWRKTDAPPAYPGPPSSKVWKDTYFNPPEDAQRIWLRRFDLDSPAVRATYSAQDGIFTLDPQQGYSFSAPFYCFSHWKPL